MHLATHLSARFLRGARALGSCRWALASIASGPAIAAAQQPTTAASAAPVVVQTSTNVVDFGRVVVGAGASASVSLQNSVSWDLTLHDPEVSCACLDATLGRRDMAAGSSNDLAIGLHPTQRVGPIHQVVRVAGEGFERSLVTIDVKALIVPPVSLEPAVLRFDAAPSGPPLPKTVSVRWDGTRFSTLGAYAQGGGVVRVTRDTTEPDGKVDRFAVSVDRDPEADHKATIVLLTSDPAHPLIRVPVEVHRYDDTFRIEPSSLALMTSELGSPATTRIRVRSLDGSAASIVGVRDVAASPCEVRLIGAPKLESTGVQSATVGMRLDPRRTSDEGELEVTVARGGETVRVRLPYTARVGATH